jgi:hypothetical protein
LTTLFLFVFTTAAVILSPIASRPASATQASGAICDGYSDYHRTYATGCYKVRHMKWVGNTVGGSSPYFYGNGWTEYVGHVANMNYYGAQAHATSTDYQMFRYYCTPSSVGLV